MKSKFLWPAFIIISFIFMVPIKLFASFTGSSLDKSLGFFIFVATALLLFLVLVFLNSKRSPVSYEINQNPYLGTAGLLVATSFAWYAVNLITLPTSSNEFFQNLCFLLLSLASAITFIFIAVSYFLGKNQISKVPILIFFPVFWYIVKMVSFLSISASTPDQYEIAMDSFILLFLLNQIKVFTKLPGSKNITGRLLMFGFPAVVSFLMFCIPEIFFQTQAEGGINSVYFSYLVIQIAVSLYISFTLINIRSQSNSN